VIAPKPRVRPRYAQSRPGPSKEGLADRMTAPLAYGVAGVKDRPTALRSRKESQGSLNGSLPGFAGPLPFTARALLPLAPAPPAMSGYDWKRNVSFPSNRPWLPIGAREPVCASLSPAPWQNRVQIPR
jgi:hypothetical protein